MSKRDPVDVYQLYGIKKYDLINDLIDRKHINCSDPEEVNYAETLWDKMISIPTAYIWYFWNLCKKKGNRKHYLEGCLKYDTDMKYGSSVKNWLKKYD